MTSTAETNTEAPHNSRIAALALAALGVVFGDIGTSPLYTLTSCFSFSGADIHAAKDVYGIASLLLWALIIVVCVKYISFIMKVDQDGEGGILALLALGAPPSRPGRPVAGGLFTIIVVVGAAMLLGDGSITPAISVISAIEGIKPLSPAAAPLVVPISVGILVALFAIQRFGTERIGKIFGPVMVVWFFALAVAGLHGIAQAPAILRAIDPRYGLEFLADHGVNGFFVLGGVVLAMTGVEALYADLSHFGRKPIVLAWYVMVLPALILCYFGEAANLLVHPNSLDNPFYGLIPPPLLVASILLSTLATVIASQALISGAYTLVEQAISLGLAPRLRVLHTSDNLRGQVYIPTVNTILAVGCITLVCAFGSSDRLAAAFGLAVSCTMLATSFAWYVVVTKKRGMSTHVALPLVSIFAIVDGSFVIAGLPKFIDGGWVPFITSAVLCLISFTWLDGRRRLVDALSQAQVPIEVVHELVGDVDDPALPTVVLLTPDAEGVPFAASHPWMRQQLHAISLVLLKVEGMHVPRVAQHERVTVRCLGPRLTIVEAYVGYMELPHLAPILEGCKTAGLDLAHENIVYASAVSRIDTGGPQTILERFHRSLFAALLRNARQISDDLEIPAQQRVGLYFPITL